MERRGTKYGSSLHRTRFRAVLYLFVFLLLIGGIIDLFMDQWLEAWSSLCGGIGLGLLTFGDLKRNRSARVIGIGLGVLGVLGAIVVFARFIIEQG